MNETQSLANQLGWCITTKDYLNNLNAETRYVAKQYEAGVIKSAGNLTWH